MSNYRDQRYPNDPHSVSLGNVELTFGPGGILSDPTPDQEAALRADERRRRRFVPVETMGKSALVEAEPVVGRGFVEAVVGKEEDDEA